jgi:NAD(P)-dependent dehydrogenase (short-subunit alcohol dehydrogenase family)
LPGRVALIAVYSDNLGIKEAHAMANHGAYVFPPNRIIYSFEAVNSALHLEDLANESLPYLIGKENETGVISSHINQTHQRCDKLVNNEVFMPWLYIKDTDRPLMSMEPKTNLTGYRYISVKAVELMKKIYSGSIKNILPSSIFKNKININLYSTLKVFLVGMTKSFYVAYGEHGVRTNILL